MPLNYNGYYALFLYFIFYKYKIFLFVQKNQLLWANILNILFVLNLNNNYVQMNSSIVKLLLKFENNLNFFYRELILIFLNDNLLIDSLLSDNNLLDCLVFICYNNLFINTKYIDFFGKLLNLFLNNFNNLKINFSFIIYFIINYSCFIFNKIKI